MSQKKKDQKPQKQQNLPHPEKQTIEQTQPQQLNEEEKNTLEIQKAINDDNQLIKNIMINESKIKVFIRTRPTLPYEEEEDNVVEIDQENNMLRITDSQHIIQSKFDRAFGPDSQQIEVFRDFQDSLSAVLRGFNFTVFAYGQTGSGKTYTMFGSDWENIMQEKIQITENKLGYQSTYFENLENDENFAGIIPRTILTVFKYIEISKQEGKQYQIYCSFLQIYNEKIYDLLQDHAKPRPLQIHESKIDGLFVEGLSEYQVNHYYDTLQLMKRGEKNRAIRQTSMNAKSSRSHTIFQLLIETSKIDENGIIRRAKINLCDLAGSEKIKKGEQIKDDHLKELKNINQSLTTLGKVIHNLSFGSKLPVPFRESKLTRILQDSLGGNTQTYVIANISPSRFNIEETVGTLKFAERARHISLKVSPNEINAKDDKIVQKLQREINYLKEILNMRRMGQNVNEMHSKLIRLQEENDRLKKTHVSMNEVEKLIEENRKMKMEIQQIYTSSQSNLIKWTEDEDQQDTEQSVPQSQQSQQNIKTDREKTPSIHSSVVSTNTNNKLDIYGLKQSISCQTDDNNNNNGNSHHNNSNSTNNHNNNNGIISNSNNNAISNNNNSNGNSTNNTNQIKSAAESEISSVKQLNSDVDDQEYLQKFILTKGNSISMNQKTTEINSPSNSISQKSQQSQQRMKILDKSSQITSQSQSRETFLQTGKMLFNMNTPQSSITEVPVRIRGKLNNFSMEKGFLEVSNQTAEKEMQRKKDKKRILERLDDLERISQQNQLTLAQKLVQIDKKQRYTPKNDEYQLKYANVSQSQSRIMKPTNITLSSSQQDNKIKNLEKQFIY